MSGATEVRERRVLGDLFDSGLLTEAVREGWVVRREHPAEPLAILNYTDRVTYARAWNPCTLACRGIVYRTDTELVIARPFQKFFNHGEPSAPPLDLGARAIVTDKLDGSLGVLYQTESGHAIATRGSFTSDQALHATELWNTRYEWEVDPPAGWTMLFEIIYPENRIVLDYRGMDDLVLLGAVEIATGESIDPYDTLLAAWPGPRATLFDYQTLADALAAPPRTNAEGVVVHLPETGVRVKLKQDDYVALHRIVTGLNERTVWEHLRMGGQLDALLQPLPEEFHDWTRDVATRLTDGVDASAECVESAFASIVSRLPAGYTRKDFALEALKTPWRAHLFARVDGKDYRPMLWDAAKPEAFRGPRTVSEDAA